MELLKNFHKHPFIRGGIIFSSASFVVSVLNYLFNLLVARSFPLADYGEYMTTLSYVALFGVPLGSFSIVLIQKIGHRSPKYRQAFVIGLEQRLKQLLKNNLLLFSAVMFSLAIFLYFKSGLTPLSISMIFLITVLNSISLLYNTSLQAFKRFALAGGVNIVGSGVKLIGFLFIVTIAINVTNVYLLLVISGVVTLGIGWYLVHSGKQLQAKSKITSQSFNPILYLRQKSTTIPLTASLGLVGLLSADLIMVKKFMSADDAGLFAALSLLSKIILYLAAPLGTVAFTFFTGKESKTQRTKVLLLTTVLLVGVGVSSVFVYAFIPELIIQLVFGSQYSPIIPFVWLAGVYGLVYALVNLLAQYWVARQSWLGVASFAAVTAQVVGIYLFHNSLMQVMWVNIAVTSLLLLAYLGGFGRKCLTVSTKKNQVLYV